MPNRSSRLDIRITPQMNEALRRQAKSRGYASPSALVRKAIERELSEEQDFTAAEERIAATIEPMRRELFRLGRSQQALFAYLDSLAKVLLTCIPEPPPDAKAQAIARAKERHNRLVKSAGSSMVGDSQAAMSDLVNRGEG